jgi:hypothetical protein
VSLPDSLIQPYPLSARLRFTTKNDWGGNLYLSNIRVFYQIAGVQDGAASDNMKIYPNPSASILNVMLPSALWGMPVLYDATGRPHKVEWIQSDEAFTYKLNTEALAGGIYYIRSYSKHNTLQGKAIILK